MSLEEQQFSGSQCFGLLNVYSGQASDTPIFLGSTVDNCYKFNVDGGGVIFIGFDTRIQPPIVRMFYDPAILGPNVVAEDSAVGFVQYGEIKLQSSSIPPSVYSPQVGYRDEYLYSLFGQQNWVDMIPSSTLKASDFYKTTLKDHHPNSPPFFAYNALAQQPNASDFLKYPMPNGNIYVRNQQTTQDNTLCATLISPLGISFNGTSKELLNEILKECLDRSFYDYMTKNESGSGYIATSNQLWKRNTFSVSSKAIWLDSFLVDIKNHLFQNFPEYEGREILQVEQVGRKPLANKETVYLLLKLSDPNDYYPYFCVSIQQNQIGEYSVFMYELDSHLLEEISTEVLEDRSIEFLDFSKDFYNQIHNDDLPSRVGVTDPYYTDDTITFRYHTQVAEYTSDGRSRTLASIYWEVSKTLDAESLEFGPAVVSKAPQLESVTGYWPANILDTKFQEILNPVEPPKKRPRTEQYALDNYQHWYEVGPRLPNNMQVFGVKDE